MQNSLQKTYVHDKHLSVVPLVTATTYVGSSDTQVKVEERLDRKSLILVASKIKMH